MDGKLRWNKETRQWAAYQDALERFHRLNESYAEAAKLAQAAGQGEDGETIRQLDLVSAAYLQVLSAERPMGGKINVGKQSSARAKAALVDAMRIYPSAWIQASNAAQATRPLMAVANPGRACYRHEGSLRVESEDGATRRIFHNANWAPPPAEADNFELDESGVVRNGRPGAIWREKVHEKKHQRERPRGPGWELGGDALWRRPKKGKQEIDVSELRVGLQEVKGGQVGARAGASTAAHEFGHRCQRLVPGISELERAFLDRRTAGTDLELYKPNIRDEWVQPDGFADRYMGREYRVDVAGISQAERKTTEILTTGVEAIFANKFGALTGLNELNRTRHAQLRPRHDGHRLRALAACRLPQTQLKVRRAPRVAARSIPVR